MLDKVFDVLFLSIKSTETECGSFIGKRGWRGYYVLLISGRMSLKISISEEEVSNSEDLVTYMFEHSSDIRKTLGLMHNAKTGKEFISNLLKQ